MIDKEEKGDAERGAVGCMLMDGELMKKLALTCKLRASWFGSAQLKTIVETIVAMWAASKPVDFMTVVDELRRAGTLDEVGGVAALEKIVDDTPAVAHAEYYLDLLRMDSLRKGCRKLLTAISAKLDEEAPEMVVTQAPAMFDAVLEEHECIVEDKPAEIYEFNIRTWEKAKADQEAGIQPNVGVRLPWRKITKLIGGLKAGLHILGARPSTGKTTMEGMIRVHAAMNGVHVLAQQIDMSKEGLLMRDQCRLAGVSYKKLNFGFARHDQIQAVKDATEMLKKLPMHFIFANSSMELLAARGRALKSKGNLGLITVDVGQLLTCAGSNRMDLVERTERVSGGLKALALELEVPLLCLLQLRRPMDQKAKEQEPDMEDLYGGRFWEANALSVALLWRHEKTWKTWMDTATEEFRAQSTHKWKHYAPKCRPVVWTQAKNQNGETGKTNFLLNTNYFQFVPADQDFKEERDETTSEGFEE